MCEAIVAALVHVVFRLPSGLGLVKTPTCHLWFTIIFLPNLELEFTALTMMGPRAQVAPKAAVLRAGAWPKCPAALVP